MTVSSLWKALDRAGCGRPVGIKELQEHSSFHKRTHPWNVNDQNRDSNCPSLAVDLSIWICEALTCCVFEKSKTDPSLHLVYTRTVKLLSLGIKLVVVIEGKRRTRHDEGEDSFCKRRSGTRFWNACQRCEQMLKLLGVPVVRAKAEGEALCALLNEKGIVDGVISNDGDCLLYGAKVLYTKFTLDNLEKKMVMRYDSSNIRACVDDDDGNQYDNEREPKEIVTLDRSDLIAFAILTGSDAVGAGLPKVGCRKAIRFIKKCQLDNPLKRKDSAMDELKSWSRTASVAKANPIDCVCDDEAQGKAKQTSCSCCGHPGTKAKHQKHGCALCGTEPGEPCFALSPGAKFRSSMRKKAMAMEVDFNPESAISVYQNPNDNQIPLPLLGKTTATLQMAYPNFQGFQDFPLVIRGQNLFESREYLKQSLSSLMARHELLNSDLRENIDATTSNKQSANKTRPAPRKINKTMVRSGKPSFEVEWIVKATVTDVEGNPMNEFIFTTIEDQQTVKRRYPKLLENFETQEKERAKQGDAEQEKRRAFLELLCTGCGPKEDSKQRADARKVAGRCFREDKRASLEEIGCAGKDESLIDPMDMEIKFIKCHDIKTKSIGKQKGNQKESIWGDDADKLLRYVGAKPKGMTKEDDGSSICSGACSIATMGQKETDAQESSSLTPGHLHFLGGQQKVPCQTSPKALRFEGCGNDPMSENTQLEVTVVKHQSMAFLKQSWTQNCHTAPNALRLDGRCDDTVYENRQMEVTGAKNHGIQSTACLKQSCTRDKERGRHSSTTEKPSFDAYTGKNKIAVRKPQELSAADKSCFREKHHEIYLNRAAYYTHMLDLSYKDDRFHSKKQLMNYESCCRKHDFDLNGKNGASRGRGHEDQWSLPPHCNLNSRHEPQDPCNADYLMQSPHHPTRRPYPQENKAEYQQCDLSEYSTFREHDNSFGTEPRCEGDYCPQPMQYSRGLELSHQQDYIHTKRQKVESNSWNRNYRLRTQQLREEEMYAMYRCKDSRLTHWEKDSDCTRAQQDSQYDDFVLWSAHREEGKVAPNIRNMWRYSPYQSSDNPSSRQNEGDVLSHCHSISDFVPQRLSYGGLLETSHGWRGTGRLQHPKYSSCVRRSVEASDGRLVQDAAEKLKLKISQATLHMECSRQLEGKSWL